jgi:hypothetical protein
MSITLDDILTVPNGASFRDVDLHVHSFGGSDDVSDTEMTPEAIIDASHALGLAVVAITDHNSDANVKKSLEYGAQFRDSLLVLPGVEITTAHGHLLVYFAPSAGASVRDLLARIEIVGRPGSAASHTRKSMADVIIEAGKLGGICVAAHADRLKTGFEAIDAGYPTWKRDILTCSALFGIEVDDPLHVRWYSESDEISAAGNERSKIYRARAEGHSTSARAELAHLQNSDSHDLAGFLDHSMTRQVTKLKMHDLSFDGFRTALLDPGARVRTKTTIPTAFPRVLGMFLEGGFLSGQTFHFSDNLNCLIGGRGTGKSTALHSVAYGIGERDVLESHTNGPDNVVLYCEDANGVRYRYERTRGLPAKARIKETKSVKEVPTDAFRIEFYAQGDISEVAKDPLQNPLLLQAFLDRHISISDLREREEAVVRELSQNSAQLIPLEANSAQLGRNTQQLEALNKQLEAAEKGKLKETAAFQTRLAAEKALCSLLKEVSSLYLNGLSFVDFKRDHDSLKESAGELTGQSKCELILARTKKVIDDANEALDEAEKDLNEQLRTKSLELTNAITSLEAQHAEFDEKILEKFAELRKQGLSGSLNDLNSLISQRTRVSTEVVRVTKQLPQLSQLRKRRKELLKELGDVRAEIMLRRKAQLTEINSNLQQTVRDYSIYLYYRNEGMIEEFKDLILEVMQGTYFQEESARAFCFQVSPAELAEWVRMRNLAGFMAKGLEARWATEIIGRFQTLTRLHTLEALWKQPQPVFKVLTKTSPQREIPVGQLSDGQKHTILLTVAMLAESNAPLLIEQPEDDLDNEFISTSVVSTLRAVKERRQIILVTHNANIAVLGDSELILPLKRVGDSGQIMNSGSIDRPETKEAVQHVLEGGEKAFKRRMTIYGY